MPTCRRPPAPNRPPRAARRPGAGCWPRPARCCRRPSRPASRRVPAGPARPACRTRPAASRTQDDVAVDGTGARIDIGLPVQRAADLDGAAGLHRAIAPAPGVGRHMAAAGGVQHRLLADPDRTGIGLGHIGLLAHARLLDGNAAAPGIETAQHGDLVRATDLDRAAGIDADARALAHHDGAALRGPVRVQRQVGAGALRQRAAQRPRCTAPASSASGRRRAGRRSGRLRGAAFQPQHRHVHVDLRAVRDGQALVAVDLVLAEAGAEQ